MQGSRVWGGVMASPTLLWKCKPRTSLGQPGEHPLGQDPRSHLGCVPANQRLPCAGPPCTQDKAVVMELLLPNHRMGLAGGRGGSLLTTGQDGRQGQGPRCQSPPHTQEWAGGAHWIAAQGCFLSGTAGWQGTSGRSHSTGRLGRAPLGPGCDGRGSAGRAPTAALALPAGLCLAHQLL